MNTFIARFFIVAALAITVAAPTVSEASWKNFESPISPFSNNITTQQGDVLGASSLTESQIQSILSLLVAFGADPATVARVEQALRGIFTNLVFSASPTSGRVPLWVDFNVSNYTPKGDEFIYFGDGSKGALGYSTPTNGRYDYNVPGTYTAQLVRNNTVLGSVVINAGTSVSDPSISLSNSLNGASYTVGQSIPIQYSYSNAPANSQVYLKLENVAPSNPPSGTNSGTGWISPAIYGSGYGLQDQQTGYSHLDYTGTYKLTAFIRECDPNGCAYGPGSPDSLKIWATSVPVTFSLLPSVTPPPSPGFGGSLALSVASTPGNQTVVPGTPRFTVVNIQADATASTEDVLLPGISLVYTDNAPTDPISCIAYTGANVLSVGNIINPNNVGSAPQSYNVSFDAPLVVPRGTVQVISFKCAIPGFATSGSFRFGLASGTSIMTKGSTSGENITPNVITNYGPTVTVSTTASALSVTTSEKSDPYRLVAAGTQQVLMGAYHFQALSEPVRLYKLGLKLTSGTANDLVRVTIWKNDNTQVGEAYFIGNQTTATSTFTQPVIIPANAGEGLTIKADLSPIGKAQPVSESGHLIKIDFLNAEAVGNTSGASVAVTGATNVAGVRVMKSFPTVSLDPLPSSGLGDGRLMRFKVTAGSNGPVSLGKLHFTWSSSNTSAPNAVDVYAYTDSNYSMPVSPGPHLGGTSQVTGALYVLLNSPLQIPAGQTRYFEVRGNVTALSSYAAFSMTLLGDSAYPGVEQFSAAKEKGYFIWSPNSVSTSLFTDRDWTNGYGVPGLPSSGLMQTRSGSAPSTPSDSFPIINAFSASPTTVVPGQPVTFSWNVSNVQQGGCYLWSSLLPGQTITPSNNWGGTGSFVLTPAVSATYTLWCASGWKDSSPSTQRSIPITVTAPSAPVITGLSPSPALVGATVTVYGSSFDSTSYVEINGNSTVTPTSFSPSTLTFVVPSYLSPGPHTIRVGKKAGEVSVSYVTLTVASPAPQTGSITSPTSFTTAQPELWGNASGIGPVKLVINLYNGDIIYSSGSIGISNGTWAHTVTNSLPNGSFTAFLYGNSGTILASGNFTVNVPSSTPPPSTTTTSTKVADLATGGVLVYSGAPVYVGSVSPVFGAIIGNNGSGNTTSAFTVSYKIDSDSDHTWHTATASEGNLILNAGTSYQSGVNYVFPSSGTWYIQACADSTNANIESNENNNCSSWSALTVYAAPSTSGGGGSTGGGGGNQQAY